MTIKVEVFGRNMDVNQRLDNYVTKRAEKLDRFLNGVEEARIDLAHVKTARSAADRNVAQITVRGKKIILRSEERADDIYAAFDRALGKMETQISRYKGKHHRGRGDGTSLSDAAAAPAVTESTISGDEDEMAPVIARRKRFVAIPMDELEAIEQMKLLGHEEFFVFYNANSSAMNVLYQRRDGSYGLLEPEVG